MGTSIGDLPMGDETHPSGAVFWLSEPPGSSWNIELKDDDGRPVAHLATTGGLPHLVVRLTDRSARFDDARRSSLRAAQRSLDTVSVLSPSHLQLRGLRGEQEHMVWWQSPSQGHVLRHTTWTAIPADWFHEPMERIAERALGGRFPSGEMRPTAAPPWHESFRYFRAAQLSDDLANSFRNIFLALECVLDTMLPKHASGLSESRWFTEAVRQAIPTCEQELVRRFAEATATGDAVEHVLSIYRDKRLTTFHSKAGPDRRLPFLEEDVRHGELEQAFADVSQLYLDLARSQLGVDRRTRTTLMRGGFEHLTAWLLGAVDIYLTTDDAPAAERVDDEVFNPRGAHVHLMHTRNSKKLEGPFERVFKGRTLPAEESEHPQVIHGIDLLAQGKPFKFSTLEAPLRLEGVDQFEVVCGLAYRHPGLRTNFRS